MSYAPRQERPLTASPQRQLWGTRTNPAYVWGKRGQKRGHPRGAPDCSPAGRQVANNAIDIRIFGKSKCAKRIDSRSFGPYV